jgi:hypothetical protein
MEFMDLCNDHGIKRQLFISRTPPKNGFVERKKQQSTGNGIQHFKFKIEECSETTVIKISTSYGKEDQRM